MVSGIGNALLRRALTRPVGSSGYRDARRALCVLMSDPAHSTGQRTWPPLDRRDAELLGALRTAVRAADPPPDHVWAGARAAFSLRDMPVLHGRAPRLLSAAASRRRGR
jgi:hypothetical protein